MPCNFIASSVVLFATCILLTGCSQEPQKDSGKESSAPQQRVVSPKEFPRNETLYVGGWDWAQPSTFNRLAPDPNWPIDGVIQIMYEALFGYDQSSGKMVPHLAKSYERRANSIEVVLDDRAVWSDGKPVTAQDVVYTFYLDKRYPTARHGMWKFLKNVSTTDSGNVLFELNPDNYNPLYVLDYLCENVILPKHVWEDVEAKSGWNDAESKADYMTLLRFKNNTSPVVSGPYNLLTYSDQKIVVVRRDNYWGNLKHGGKKPVPKYIIHSLLSSNSNFTGAMVKGHLDVASHFLPRIWNKRKDKIRAWSNDPPYHESGSIPSLTINLKRSPLDDVQFRRALAHAIDFERVNTLAMSKYSPKMKPGFILPFGVEAKYYSSDDAAKFGYYFDPGKAQAILKAAGYSFNSRGELLSKDGKKMRAFEVECPRGWSDWESAIRVVINGFSKIGVTANESLVDYGIWKQNLSEGQFDFSIDTKTPMLWPSTPWRRFAQVMSNENTRPIGESAYENYGRYSDNEVEKMLRELPRLTDQNHLVAAYRALNIKFMQDIPVLPLMYRPTEFYQFSEKHWTGFPSKENPTAPPQCLMIGAGISGLWGLRPVSPPTAAKALY